jgi:hypothetical protein
VEEMEKEKEDERMNIKIRSEGGRSGDGVARE